MKKINLIGAMSLTNGVDASQFRELKSLGVEGRGAAALQVVRSIPDDAVKSTTD